MLHTVRTLRVAKYKPHLVSPQAREQPHPPVAGTTTMTTASKGSDPPVVTLSHCVGEVLALQWCVDALLWHIESVCGV